MTPQPLPVTPPLHKCTHHRPTVVQLTPWRCHLHSLQRVLVLVLVLVLVRVRERAHLPEQTADPPPQATVAALAVLCISTPALAVTSSPPAASRRALAGPGRSRRRYLTAVEVAGVLRARVLRKLPHGLRG